MTQLGRYEILQQLATGPVADVLLARAKGLEGFTRHVVVKQIRPELASDERFVQAFLNEARIGASLHHQNIVQVYDIDEDRGRYYFAMEYVHGEDVRKLLLKVREQNTLVPLDQVVTIGAAAAAGLHHAHEQTDANRSPLGLVHRDVSPGNILIGFDGSVKLVDFGLAKPALSSIKTRTGSIAGKAPYMSPELCQGKPIDRRSDIFALGIVLYELATARRLFKGDNDYQTMASIVEGEIAPPSTHRLDIPQALDEIILRALAKKPEARFQTAVDLRAALEGFALDLELRTTSKALADYMVRLFGARAEPWQADAPKNDRALDSESDFDEGRLGLVSAPTGSVDLPLDASAPIAVARSQAERTPFVNESPSRTALDMRAEDEETSTSTATLTVAEALMPAELAEPTIATVRGGPSPRVAPDADFSMDPTVRGMPSPKPAVRAPSPRGATALASPPPASTTGEQTVRHLPSPSTPPPPAVARTSSPGVARTSSPGLPSVRTSSPSLPPVSRPAPPPPARVSPPSIPPSPPAILGTPNQPARVMRPLLAPRAFEDEVSEDGATEIDSADEATTVQPPLFPSPELGRAPEPEHVYVPPPQMAAPRAVSEAAMLSLRPAWVRYLIVVLGIAIPLAVGFGSRSCNRVGATVEHTP